MPSKMDKKGLVARMDTVEEDGALEDSSISHPMVRSSMAGMHEPQTPQFRQQRPMQNLQPQRQVDTEAGTAVRLPIEYGSINMAFEFSRDQDAGLCRPRGMSDASGRVLSTEAELARTSAAMSRYKYYSRIAPGAASRLIMPAHVVPARFLLILPFKSAVQNQSSIITIFSIWNTMMGTSLLSMPWAVKESGFATSLVVLAIMTGLTCYTAYRVLDSYNRLVLKGIRVSEFSDVCKYYMGRSGEVLAIIFSAMALLGGVIVYWVLLSNFLYQTGQFVYNYASDLPPGGDATPSRFEFGNHTYDVVCPLIGIGGAVNQSSEAKPTATPETPGGNSTVAQGLFNRLWRKTDTVPFYLLLFVFPLISVKSPGFFSKFNALGTLAAGYLLVFVIIKAFNWGLHMDFDTDDAMLKVQQFSPKFFSYSGILSVALFCHCFLILLVKPAKNPKNNPRDLIIAYVCVSVTYLLIGVLFYASYPLAKSCIEQNFLDNVPSSDILAFTARIFLFVQMLTVFPLLVYILRAQLMHYFFGSVYPSWLHVLLFHAGIVGIALLVAHFYPNIGSILRLSGAICGLAYVFTLPTVVYLISEKQASRLSVLKCAAHFCIIAVGVANFVAQFFFF